KRRTSCRLPFPSFRCARATFFDAHAHIAVSSFLVSCIPQSTFPKASLTMFSAAVRVSVAGIRSLTRRGPQCTAPLASRCYSHAKTETDEEFDARWVTYFRKPDLDEWELRKGVNTLIGYDLVPEPKILDSALRACRKLNDLASAVRILEAVKDKSGPHKEIYPYPKQVL
ncbi:hypothetical protein AMELA_G00041270, partial [Ameiurus melas]